MNHLAVTNASVRDGKSATTKKTFSRETSVSLDIQADPGIVWSLLTNAADYPRWNSTVASLKGEIKAGETIELKSILDESRTFKLKVKEVEPGSRLVWGDSMGNRVYTLDKGVGDNVTFTMTEKIGGPLFPLFAGAIPPFDETFEKFAADLKKEAETIQSSKS
jgi:uncharacterized protein YndB with AHSA1/START domain